jgi:hypothetical protein
MAVLYGLDIKIFLFIYIYFLIKIKMIINLMATRKEAMWVDDKKKASMKE